MKGLKELLEYADTDIEDTFVQTFNISYKDVFGVVYNHELKVSHWIILLYSLCNLHSFFFLFLAKRQ